MQWWFVRSALCVFSWLAWTSSVVLAAGSRPNIVLIMADDMGYSDLGCYGSEIATPNLDRLAGGGLRFTQFYNTARCCPTRASLMTGLYPHQAGIGHMVDDRGLPGYRGDLADTCVTIAEVLESAGYATYMSGKWHVTTYLARGSGELDSVSQRNWPRQRGFDAYFGLLHGGGTYFNPRLFLDNSRYEVTANDFYLTDAITDKAAEYIRKHSQTAGDKPFFLYVAYTAPHWPLHALPADIERYKGKYDGGWDDLRQRRYEKMLKLGTIQSEWGLSPRDPAAPAWADAPDKAWHARRMEVYAAQIDVLDRGVGRIIDQIDKAGVSENTLVIFLADNGGCAEELRGRGSSLSWADKTRDGRPVQQGNIPSVMPGPDDTFQSYGLGWANASNTPFRLYKHFVHEGGISTPFIAYWPAVIKQAGLTGEVGHVIDVMATCADVAGATYPTQRDGRQITPLEGRSLSPVFRGQARQGHKAVFWEHEGNRAVRQGDWKLVARGSNGEWELYDLATDRSELHDLASQHPEKVAELSRLYDEWAKRCNVVEWTTLPKPKK